MFNVSFFSKLSRLGDAESKSDLKITTNFEQNGKTDENEDPSLNFESEFINSTDHSDIDEEFEKSDKNDRETNQNDSFYENFPTEDKSRITFVLNGDENEFENEYEIEDSKYELASSSEIDNDNICKFYNKFLKDGFT